MWLSLLLNILTIIEVTNYKAAYNDFRTQFFTVEELIQNMCAKDIIKHPILIPTRLRIIVEAFKYLNINLKHMTYETEKVLHEMRHYIGSVYSK